MSSCLKVVEFAQLDKTGLHFHRSLLQSLLCDYSEETCRLADAATLPASCMLCRTGLVTACDMHALVPWNVHLCRWPGSTVHTWYVKCKVGQGCGWSYVFRVLSLHFCAHNLT